jgi:hypothetical protein
VRSGRRGPRAAARAGRLLGRLDIRDTLCEREQVVGLSVYAAHVGWNRNLGPGPATSYRSGRVSGWPPRNLSAALLSILLRAAAPRSTSSARLTTAAILTMGPALCVGGQLDPAGG